MPTSNPMHEIAYDAALEAFESLPKPRRRDPQAVEEAVKRGVRAAIASQLAEEADMPGAGHHGIIAAPGLEAS